GGAGAGVGGAVRAGEGAGQSVRAVVAEQGDQQRLLAVGGDAEGVGVPQRHRGQQRGQTFAQQRVAHGAAGGDHPARAQRPERLGDGHRGELGEGGERIRQGEGGARLLPQRSAHVGGVEVLASRRAGQRQAVERVVQQRREG